MRDLCALDRRARVLDPGGVGLLAVRSRATPDRRLPGRFGGEATAREGRLAMKELVAEFYRCGYALEAKPLTGDEYAISFRDRQGGLVKRLRVSFRGYRAIAEYWSQLQASAKEEIPC
jgi:hypothetical protein